VGKDIAQTCWSSFLSRFWDCSFSSQFEPTALRDAGVAVGQGEVVELRAMKTYKKNKILLPVMLVSV